MVLPSSKARSAPPRPEISTAWLRLLRARWLEMPSFQVSTRLGRGVAVKVVTEVTDYGWPSNFAMSLMLLISLYLTGRNGLELWHRLARP